jgi:hypothetical protein
MGADREPFLVPYGRPISLRIHPALLARLNHEVRRLNQARPVQPVTRSGLIQQALRLLLDGPAERTEAAVQATPVSGIAEAQRHWQTNGAPLVAEHKARESRRRGCGVASSRLATRIRSPHRTGFGWPHGMIQASTGPCCWPGIASANCRKAGMVIV